MDWRREGPWGQVEAEGKLEGKASAPLSLPGQRDLLHCQDTQKLNHQGIQATSVTTQRWGPGPGVPPWQRSINPNTARPYKGTPSSLTLLKQEEQELLLCNISCRAHTQLLCLAQKGEFCWVFCAPFGESL